MIGWIAAAALALLAAGAIGRVAGARTLGLVGAALCLGLAGYAWQGRPDLPSRPAPRTAPPVRDDLPVVAERQRWTSQFGEEGSWLAFADGYDRRGDTLGAVQVLQNGIGRHPRSAVLWLGLANALVIHADGTVPPAARLAFARAQALDPESPAPALFLGLTLAGAGEDEEARRVWKALLARAPAGAAWRADLARRLAALEEAAPK